MKHTLKKLLRTCVSKFFGLTGLRAMFRSGRHGVPVLMFHNVGYPKETEYLPDHMKISESKLSKLLRRLGSAGYRTVTVSEMVAELETGTTPGDAIVLTFDDGYRDNHDVLLPILAEHEAVATVYVQTGPMKGRLNWLHHYFWVLHRIGPHELGGKLAERIEKPHLAADLRGLPSGEVEGEYQLKRLLKYEVRPEDRDEMLSGIFEELGGDDATLASEVYLDPEACRALDRAGVEIGAHTVNHLVLSSLEAKHQRLEIEGSLTDLESWLGHDVPAFAYPYGRTWDYDAATLEILGDLGFESSVTAMPGLNTPGTSRMELRRFAVNQDTDMAELLCEVDGVFDWFERRGVNLRVG